MSKPTTSAIIQNFIDLVDNDHIQASTQLGECGLFLIDRAFRSILDGKDPVEALELARGSGAARKSHSLTMAVNIHYHKYRVGEPWSVVELLVNDWRRHHGLKEIKLVTIRKHHARYKDEVLEFFSRADRFIAENTSKPPKDT